MQQSVFSVLFETLFEANFRACRPEKPDLTLAPMARGLLPPLPFVKTCAQIIFCANPAIAGIGKDLAREGRQIGLLGWFSRSIPI
ncbi:hypothetical protein [Rhizobium sp. L1K21]|uniref:hypothetical protein n=1 Tax=Rhizobium sp. L1K21 TaxID=2954933 RepID=UPI002092F306|nr:hypothetical protein [Rhizobium sp. L1K21]MCO6186402.1 hypothetical protein [Rhizobium sp. L1K21]